MMTNPTDNILCDPFEELLSARIDGELSVAQTDQLDRHLSTCDHCARLAVRFGELDSLIKTAGELEAADAEPVCPAKRGTDGARNTLKPLTGRNSPGRKSLVPKSGWRLFPIAVAATLLAGIIGLAIRTPNPASAGVTVEQVARPIAELQVLNQRSHQTNELMLQTLALDLRAMRLELNCIENSPRLDSPPSSDKQLEMKQLTVKLEQLTARLEQMKTP